jgi:hypothetical protein
LLACSSTPWWAPISLMCPPLAPTHHSPPSIAPNMHHRSSSSDQQVPCHHFMVHSKWATLLSSFREWFSG